jgi:DNA-binding NtrC family response regulator
LAATNRDLALEVSAGNFREDLFYRLAVVELAVPPLRERLEDLPLLIAYLLEQIGVDPSPFLGLETLERLSRHRWPGNVRELRNTLQRAAALARPVTLIEKRRPEETSEHRPRSIDLGVPLRLGRQRIVDDYERDYLTAMIEQCQGNISEAARRAQLERMTIYRMMRRLGIREPPR